MYIIYICIYIYILYIYYIYPSQNIMHVTCMLHEKNIELHALITCMFSMLLYKHV